MQATRSRRIGRKEDALEDFQEVFAYAKPKL
jgi:hypothetical protein